MANHNNKHNKETLNSGQSRKEKDQIDPIDPEIGASSDSNGVVDGVQNALDRMNTKMEMMIGYLPRMIHDRGKEIDRFNGGFREFGNIGHRRVLLVEEMGVQGQLEDMKRGIRSNDGRNESKSFDRMANQKWCSTPTAMDYGDRDLVITIGDVQYPITEKVLHQIFDSFGSFEIIDLFSLKNGDVQAWIGFRCSSSAAWAKLSLQGRCIYTGCCHMEIEFYKPQQGEFNGGFHEFQIVDSHFQCSSMESETSRHPFMANLIRNGDSEASRQQTYNKSEILEAKIQALCNFVNRSPIENEGIRNSHPIATSEIMPDKFHRGFGYDAENEYSVLGKAMAVNETNGVLVEKEEELVKAEVLLVDEELEIGINCGAVDANIGTEMSENGAAKNGLLQVIFNDPFYEAIKSVLVNDKMHLVLAIGLVMVEIKYWLIVGCEVFMALMCSQDSVAAGIGAQWLRQGVG